MKPNSTPPVIRWCAALALLLLTLFTASASNLNWDANTGTAGAQDGNGNWGSDANNTNWWNGAANVTWNNANGDTAVLGVNATTNVTVTVTNNVSAGGIIYSNNLTGTNVYTIANSGGAVLTLSGNPTIQLSGASNGVHLISAIMSAANTVSVQSTLTNANSINFRMNATNSIGSLAVGTPGNTSYTTNGLFVDINSAVNTSAALNGLVANLTNVTVYSNATFRISGANVAYTLAPNPMQITICGDGSSGGANTNNSGAWDVTGNAGGTIAANVVLAGDSTIDFNNGSAANQIYTLNGIISGTGRLLLVSGNAAIKRQTCVLTNASTYVGNTIVAGGTTLQLIGANDRLPTSTVLTLGTTAFQNFLWNTNGFLTLGNTTSAINQTVAGLTSELNGTGSNSIVAGGNTSTASFLTVNNASDNTFVGTMGGTGLPAGNIGLIKGNAGTLFLHGPNRCSGGYTVNNGTLQFGNGNTDYPFSGPITNNNAAVVFKVASANTNASVITGSGTFTKLGNGKLTLSAANTYTGNTLINAGTLALSASGSLAAGSTVCISNAATFDVSSNASYAWGTSAGLTASGFGTTPGADAAELKGGTTVSLDSRPVTLNFAPTAFAGDSAHPSLYVSSGTLTINGAITVNNTSGTPLGTGTYTLIKQASGSISGSPFLAGGIVQGSGVASGLTPIILVSGGEVQLRVGTYTSTTTALTRHAGTGSSTTYGDSLSFDVSVSSGSGTPTGTVDLYDGGTSGTMIGSGTLDGSGNATITPSVNALSAGTHNNIVAVYVGDFTTYADSTSSALAPAQVVAQKSLSVTGATANNKYYDTTTAVLITGGSLVGVVSGDAGNLTLIQNASFNSVGPGASIAVTDVCTLSGSASGNYALTQPTGLAADIRSTAIWIGGGVDTNWATAGNWDLTLVPSAPGLTNDFSTLNITVDTNVSLGTTPRISGGMIFGDTDTSSPAGWTISGSTLTLSNNTATPTITVNALGTGKVVTIGSQLAGSQGMTKTGNGTLVLTNTTSAANSTTPFLAGTKTVSQGTLKIDTSSWSAATTAFFALGTNAILSTLELYGTNVAIDRNMLSSSNTVITGSGTINKTGTGYLDIGGSAGVGAPSIKNFTGQINVQQGCLAENATDWTNSAGLMSLDVSANAYFDLRVGDVMIDKLTGTGVVGTTLNSPVNKTLTVGNNNGSATFSGIISNTIFGGTSGGTVSLTKNGTGTQTLSGTNTYTGSTRINGGTLSLDGTGSISNTTLIAITNGATFDVSANGITLTGSSPQQTLAGSSTAGQANINSAAHTVTLASGALLSFQAGGGVSSTVGKISTTGNLTLNGNATTINVNGSALAVGSYRLLDCTGTLVTNSPLGAPSITGTALSGGYTRSVSVTTGSSGHVDFVVQATPLFSNLSNPSIVYGTSSVTLTGTLSSATGPTTVYPANGDTVTATINGHAVSGFVTDITGDFTIIYNDASLATNGVASYIITYAYAGNNSVYLNAAANDTSKSLTVTKATTSIGLVSSENPSGYQDSIHFTASLPADATGNVVFKTNGVVFDTKPAGATVNSASTAALPRGATTITAEYAGDGNYFGSTNNSLSQMVTNHPPVLTDATYTRNAGVNQLNIPVASLLSNASDVDGDTLSLSSVGTSTNGVTPTISGNYVVYNNPNNVTDKFSYTVSDGHGGTASANVIVNLNTSSLFGQSASIATTGGAVTLTFAGIPTYSYSVQRAEDMNFTVNPTIILTTNAPAGGVFKCTDSNPPTPSAYYRLQWNP
jgi:autotransporter-associated beta strand protein